MLEFDEPDISSIAEEIKLTGQVMFKDISIPLLEITEGGDSTVDLEENDYRKYFHMRVRNIEKKFKDGEMVRTDTFFDIERCQQSMFQNNEYYENYWNTFKERAQYCVANQQDLYFEGTRDSPLKEQDSAYVIYEFLKCSNETKKAGYPECASPTDI